MYNYSLYHIVNRNILSNAIVTGMNEYIIIGSVLYGKIVLTVECCVCNTFSH